jgi:beta-lactamase superfamily II metal-dependent hydrolase
MLNFHVLNVGHGSSVVIEFDGPKGKAFGVVDSNLRPSDAEPRALWKLKQLGAKRLSFVCLTHPHKDHFKGLFSIIQAFSGAIDYFYTSPLGDLFRNKERLKKLAEKLQKIKNMSDGEPRKDALEFLQIIRWATTACEKKDLDWRECAGENYQLAPTAFTGVEIATILPPTRAKGQYIQQIERQDGSIIGTFQENEISLALEFTFGGVKTVLGGDGTIANWRDRRRWEANKGAPIGAALVNLPHHGSHQDCDDSVLSQLFDAQDRRAGLTSANGQTHPSIEVIKWMERNGIQPYCTNLIPQCGANAQRLLTLPGIEPRMARWLREVASNSGNVQACQGDILVSVDADGNSSVSPQLKNACAFRGDFKIVV